MDKYERKFAKENLVDVTDYDEKKVIKVDFIKICAFLLVIIIFLILYFNGFFYKFKKITGDNLDQILSSDMLTEEEKSTILFKSFFSETEGKRIYELLK